MVLGLGQTRLTSSSPQLRLQLVQVQEGRAAAGVITQPQPPLPGTMPGFEGQKDQLQQPSTALAACHPGPPRRSQESGTTHGLPVIHPCQAEGQRRVNTKIQSIPSSPMVSRLSARATAYRDSPSGRGVWLILAEGAWSQSDHQGGSS